MPGPSVANTLNLMDRLKTSGQNRLLTDEQIRGARTVNALNEMKAADYPADKARAIRREDINFALKKLDETIDYVSPDNYEDYAKTAVNEWGVPPSFFPNPQTFRQDPGKFNLWHKKFRAHIFKLDEDRARVGEQYLKESSLQYEKAKDARALEEYKQGEIGSRNELNELAKDERGILDRQNRIDVAKIRAAGSEKSARIRAAASGKGLTPDKAAKRITEIREGIAKLEKGSAVDSILASMMSEKLGVDVPVGQIDPELKRQYIEAAEEEIAMLQKVAHPNQPGEGTIIRNPTTGERRQMKNGQWVQITPPNTQR